MKKKAIFTLFSTALLLGSTGISSVSVFADELPKTAVGKILRRSLVEEEKERIAK